MQFEPRVDQDPCLGTIVLASSLEAWRLASYSWGAQVSGAQSLVVLYYSTPGYCMRAHACAQFVAILTGFFILLLVV